MGKPQAGEKLFRSFQIEKRPGAIDVEARTVEVAFSSEAPVLRWFGKEILNHGPDGCDLGRLNNGGAVLVVHDTADQVGVVENARVDADKVGRAVLRFGNSLRATEIFKDICDGIRQHISVGYAITDAQETENSSSDSPEYRVKWMPYEISTVPVPADVSVGVGRAANFESGALKKEGAKQMDKEMEGGGATIEVVREQARVSEQTRVGEILAMADRHGASDMAREAIIKGTSLDQFRQMILEKIATIGAVRGAATQTSDVGMSPNEVKSYSLFRAIMAAANKDWSGAGLEHEASKAEAKRRGKDTNGFFVPDDVLGVVSTGRRDLTVGVAAQGGNLVQTDVMIGSFIDLLRNKMICQAAGATVIPGLVGNVAIPRMTGGAQAYWVGEGTPPTESTQAIDQVTMTPKTAGTFTDVSRKLLLQTAFAVEAMVRNDLAVSLATEFDRAGLNGSGSGAEPKGVAQQTGVNLIALGTNGAKLSWDSIVDMETQVAVDNADVGSLSYIFNAKTRGAMKVTEQVSGYPQYLWGADRTVNGYRAFCTNQLPSNLTKGEGTGLSAGFFGNWNDLVIGLWGGLEILVNPYILSTAGIVRVQALQDIDVAVRHPESFSVCKDIVTA